MFATLASQDANLREAVRELPGAVEYHRTISAAELLAFAAATGDDNRVHMDQTYAEGMGMRDLLIELLLLSTGRSPA